MSYFANTITKLDPSYSSAFGTLETGELVPVFQGDFVYGLNTQIWNTAVVSGSTIDTNTSRLRIQSGTGSTNYGYITSKKIIRYRAGQGTIARFTPLFTAGVVNNTQLWGVGTMASNVPVDGYFFGYSGTTYGIAYYNNSSLTWIPQSTWNGTYKVDGSAGSLFTLNPTFGTPVMIKYPFLGYGNVFFFIQNPNDGSWVLAHTIRYANTSITTELSNPTLQFIGYNLNTGNTTNQIMYCGSVGMFISGQRNFIGNPRWAIDANKGGVTTETSFLNLKNCTTFNGVVNRGTIRLNTLSLANGTTSNNNVCTTMLKIGTTLGGSPSYTPINGSTADGGVTITSGNSIVSYDTAATTVSGGNYIYNISAGSGGNHSVDLTPFDLYINPGEILTISCKSTTSSTLGISINWSEDI